MGVSHYFGDIRDRFDELYPTATSFVSLPNSTAYGGAHIRFNLDLDEEQAIDQFRVLCYAYEDSFEWESLPLVFDLALPLGMVRWQNGGRIVCDLPMEQALAHFNERCRSLLTP